MAHDVWSQLAGVASRKWMGVYLRVLAVVYALGGLVHIGNILGLGDIPWSSSPTAWRVGDVAYGVIDVVASLGLWRRAPWGVIAFVVAACSQLVLYLGWPDVFAFTREQRSALQGLVMTHIATLLGLAALWIARK